jgi:hypothetical protein
LFVSLPIDLALSLAQYCIRDLKQKWDHVFPFPGIRNQLGSSGLEKPDKPVCAGQPPSPKLPARLLVAASLDRGSVQNETRRPAVA